MTLFLANLFRAHSWPEDFAKVPMVCDSPVHPCRSAAGKWRKCPGMRWFVDDVTELCV